MASAKAVTAVLGFVAQGRDGNWTWEQMAEAIMNAEGVAAPDGEGKKEREKQLKEESGRALRGFYSTREKAWNATWETNDETKNREATHAADLALFEADFTLKHRPAPPPKPKKEKEKKEEGDDAPPAPPAPPEG